MALYVAVALHLLALLIILLLPAPQAGPGPGEGVGIGLQLSGEDGVLGPAPIPRSSTPQPVETKKSEPRILPRSEAISIESPTAYAPVSTRAERRAPDQPGTAGMAPKAGGGGAERYLARLRLHLNAFRREMPAGIGPGKAEVRFTVAADGSVQAMSLQGRSGSPQLDAEALDLIRRAQPLPRPPDGRSVELAVPIVIER